METLPDDLYHNDNHMWDVSKRTASSASPGVAWSAWTGSEGCDCTVAWSALDRLRTLWSRT